MTRALSVEIPLAMAVSAALSMALEIVAGRLLAPYVGMSLYSWSATIAVVLSGLSIGHWLGGVLVDRSRRHAEIVAVALLLAAVATVGSLFVLRAVAPLALGGVDPVSGIAALALSAFLLPSFLAGVLSPLLTAMALEAATPERRGRVLGRMFALGAFGAILGTVGTGFWLVSWVGSHSAVLLIGGAYALLAVPFLGRRRTAITGAVGLAAAATVAGGTGAVPALRSPCDRESAY